MSDNSSASTFISRASLQSDTARFANRNGDIMFGQITKTPARNKRIAASLTALLISNLVAVVSLVGISTTQALACACGCSVFDVGGLSTPQEQDHGGRVFFEFWDSDQTQNYVGSSRAPAAGREASR